MKERNVLIGPVTVVICRFDSERESGGRWQEGGGCGERFKVKCKSFVPVLVAPVYKNNKFTGRCIYFLSMYQSFLDIVMIDTGRRAGGGASKLHFIIKTVQKNMSLDI